jgi:hypothetical protein
MKLSSVLSDIMGLSGRAILQGICEGESDPERLAKRIHPGVRASREQMVAALTAEVREHHRFAAPRTLVTDCGSRPFNPTLGRGD